MSSLRSNPPTATSSPPLPSVVEKIPQAVSTTTLFASPSGSAVAPSAHTDSIPVGAIVGGVLAGVVLAVAAVLVWHLWGRSIKRRKAKERKEALAFRELKENTRRNASAFSRGYDSYKPSFMRGGERAVKFSQSSSSSNQSTVKSVLSATNSEEKEKQADVLSEAPAAKQIGLRVHNHVPVRSSPLAHTTIPPEPSTPSDESRPSLPRTPSARSEQQLAVPARRGLEVPKLAHKSSTTSSVSVYSTQSGEERTALVPPSLIMAALSRPDPRKPLVDRVSTPPSAYVGDEDEVNRLSHISEGSAHLQHASDDSDSPSDSVGYAN